MQKYTKKTMRQSSIIFNANPKKTRMHNGFKVIMDYDNESDKKQYAPAIIDLSHMSKWDVQDMHLNQIKPLGQNIPGKPGECSIQNKKNIIFRLNHTQACIWHILPEESPQMSEIIPAEPPYTDITDAHALLAIVGPSVPSFIEKITNLDLMSPHRNTPFVMQGPILHIASRILVLQLEKENSVVLFSFSRGYGQIMAEALLDSGSRQGVYFAGEQLFWST
ncbi:MAG: hypothetical protein ABIJ59_09305 [Pseudomonadota bacterium]